MTGVLLLCGSDLWAQGLGSNARQRGLGRPRQVAIFPAQGRTK